MHPRSGWHLTGFCRLRLSTPLGKFAAISTAAAVAAALLVAVAVVQRGHGAAAPVQQVWGSLAARRHRVGASATMVQLVNGRAVPVPAGRRAPGSRALPRSRQQRGAVPAARRFPRLRLPARGTAAEAIRGLRQPTPVAKKGFNPATSHVVRNGTSADTVTYQNADGTKTTMVYQWPVNWRRPDGSWARIDTSLVPAGTDDAASLSLGVAPSLPPPSLVPSSPPLDTAAPSAQPTPPGTPGGPAPGYVERSVAEPAWFAPYADAGTLVRLPLDGSHAVGFALAGATHAAAAVQGSSVTYAGATADSDARFTGGAGFVKEQLVLRSAAAPAAWVFPLRLTGLRARATAGGTIAFTDAAGTVVAVIPHGFMTDSKIDPHSGDGAYSAGVSYSLTSFGGRPAVRMTLDEAWLRARARVFPVTVDPSVSAINSGGTTYVLYPYTNDYSSDTEIKIGTYDGGSNKAKSFMKFGGVSSSLTNDNVLGARLGVFNSWSYSCSPRTAYVYPITQSWSVSGNKSWPGPSTGSAIARKSFATGWVPLGSTQSPCPASWQGFDLGKAGNDLLNGWTHGTTANNGLALGASDSDSYGWKKFTSDSAPSGDPFLAVTYTPYGATYKLASSKPVKQVWPNQNGEIKLKVTNTGASTWTTTNGYELSYRAYDATGKLVADHPVFTPMPSDVAPGETVTVDAVVDALPVGDYAIDFDMYANATTSSPVSFRSQGVAPFAVGLSIPQPPPVVDAVYPPTGYLAPTVTPELSTTAFSTTGTSITYDFSIACNPLPGQTCPASVIDSGTLSKPYWTTPPLAWDVPYTWTVKATTGTSSTTVGPVSIIPEVPQPASTSQLGASGGQAFDPQTGNYFTSATDAAVAVAGPPLRIGRSYNSLNPRTSGGFGAGWSDDIDMGLAADNDGSGDVVVTMADGSQERFGCTLVGGACSYTPPMGSSDVLTHNSDGTWSMMAEGGIRYDFTSGKKISKITDPDGLAQTFTLNSSNEVVTITDAASGRALHLTWSTPSGAAHPHVGSVATDPPASGQPGLTWSYSYSGDELTKVCAPAGGCASYTYATTGSEYPAGVMNDGPRSYWQLGDAAGATAAADEVDANLDTSDGTYNNVTLGSPGPLNASAETAASFDGTSSYVTLPDNVMSDQTYEAIEVWFKAASSTASGVLFSYQADKITSSTGNSDPHTPALYVGGDGKLYGELWNGKVDPMSSSASVTDGSWHYVVLTGSGTSQSLWLDGTKIASLSGQIDQQNMTHDVIGAGFWGGWPAAYATEGSALVNTPVGYFGGAISQAAVYPHPLGQPAITAHYALAQQGSPEMTQVTLPTGTVFQQAGYDAATDRLATYTDPNGGQWQIHEPLATGYKATSDSLGEVTRHVTVADPAGRNEVYGYDALNGGRIVSYDRGAGSAPRTFGYDAAGFLNSVTDEDGNLVTFTNDIHGNVLTRTWYPTQPASVAGSPATQTTSGSTSSSSCTTSGAACTTYYSYYFNGANPLDPQNNELTAVRDARSASATDNTYLTSYGYNTAGELTSVTTPATSDFPSGRTTTYSYATGSEAAIGGGSVPAGLLLSQTTPGGAVTSYGYYSNGDLAQITQPSGRRTAYTYDGIGRSATSTDYTSSFPSGLVTTYSYNAANQPLTVTHPGVTDQVTGTVHTLKDTYTYDANGNLTQLTQSDTTGGDAARTTSYTYDGHGRVATVTEPAGATSGSNPPPEGAPSPYPAGATTAYTYDDSGNVVSKVDADGNTYDYTYNEYGEATQITLHTNPASQASPTATCSPPQTQAPDGGCDLVIESDAYDPAGLLAAQTDAMGRITNYTYYFNQALATVQQTDPATNTGRMATFTYDPAGNLTSQTVSGLAAGQITASTVVNASYDAANRLTSQVTDPVPSGTSAGGYVNRTTSYTYDADNHVTSQTDTGALGSAQTSYGYDTAGDLTSQTVADGSTNLVTTWTYNQLGLPISMTDPRGNVTGATASGYTANYGYDEAGNLATVTTPPVTTQSYGTSAMTTRSVNRYGYDTFGDQTETEDPNLNLTTSTYDGDGRVTSVTQPPYTPPGATAPITATTSYAYDGNGNLVKVTDPAGNATSYGYDGLGDLVSKTDPQLSGQPAPGVWAYTYDAAGEQLSATDPTGATTTATYDYFGNQATSTQDIRTSGGTQYNTTSYLYDYLGDPTQITTPAGVVTKNTYDHVGELASTTDAYGNTTSFAYDYAGRVAQITNPDNTFTTYGYDPAGDLTAVTDYGYVPPPQLPPVLRTTSFGYDPAGNLASTTDGRKDTTTFSYDAANELTSQTQPVSSGASITSSYSYDPAWNQTSATDGRGNTTWTTYNTWNLPESVIEPATPSASSAADRTWTTGYDADGRVASVTQPGGISQTDSYDQLGDLSQQTGAGAQATTSTQTFGYDLDGRITSASAPGGTDTFSYNDAGQVTATGGPSGTASFTYNGDGDMTKRADAAGSTGYTYDKAGRLASATDPLTGATMAYGYNPESQPASIAYATGGVAGPTRTFGYDQLHQLTSDTLTAASGATIASAGYGYDGAGNLTSQTTTGFAGASATTYGYDQANRLTSATTGGTTTGYGYDAASNLTQAGGTTYNYNAADQLTNSTNSAGTTSYDYTLSGALSSVTPPSGTGQTFTNNAYGQTATATTGTSTISYGYDGLGRLATRATGGTTTSLAYSGTGNTLASDGAATYSNDPSGGLIGAKTAGGAAQAAITSPVHGDLTGLFSPTSGTVSLAASAAYSPYGTVSAHSGTMPAVGYQGGYTDPGTHQVNMAARWYNPSTAGFTSNDTLAGTPMPATVNPSPYGYTGGNPLTGTDPTGHTCDCGQDPGDLMLAERLGERVADPPERLSGRAPLAMAAVTGLSGVWLFQLLRDGYFSQRSAAPRYLPSFTGPDYGMHPYGGYGYYASNSWSIDYGISSLSPYYGPAGGPCPAYLCGPPAPPPPPPPPQDCYAGPNPSCKASPAPRWLLHGEYIVGEARDISSYKHISAKDRITEQSPPNNNTVAGTQPGSNTDTSGDSNSCLTTSLVSMSSLVSVIGVPPTPAGASTSPDTSGQGGICSADPQLPKSPLRRALDLAQAKDARIKVLEKRIEAARRMPAAGGIGPPGSRPPRDKFWHGDAWRNMNWWWLLKQIGIVSVAGSLGFVGSQVCAAKYTGTSLKTCNTIVSVVSGAIVWGSANAFRLGATLIGVGSGALLGSGGSYIAGYLGEFPWLRKTPVTVVPGYYSCARLRQLLESVTCSQGPGG